MSPIALDNSAPNGSRAAATPAPSHANNYSSETVAVDPTAARRPVEPITVDSPNLKYTDEALFAKYTYHSTQVKKEGDRYTVKPVEKPFEFKTVRKVPKTG